MVFIADMTGLDLREQERYWELVVKGKENEYHGVAVHPRHLSLYERVVLKRHLQYDAELDRQQKINELRAVYESTKDFSAEKGEHDLTVEQREFLGNEALVSTKCCLDFLQDLLLTFLFLPAPSLFSRVRSSSTRRSSLQISKLKLDLTSRN